MPEAQEDTGNRIGSLDNVIGGGLVVGLGTIAILVYGVYGHGRTSVGVTIAVAMIAALGALAAAFLLGFLFGVPRAPVESAETRTRASTNLEQISDWLTKILVGVGLAQFDEIGDALGRLNTSVANGISSPANETFAGGILTYFGVFGFLAGWIIARIYVTRAVSGPEVERIARRVADEQIASLASQ